MYITSKPNKNKDTSYFDHYFQFIKKLDSPQKHILHLGSGWDKRNITGHFHQATLFSIDLDFLALKKNKNPLKINGNVEMMPIRTSFFDGIICEDLMEHIQIPFNVLLEIKRILKSPGFFVFVTPMKWSYISFFARITPLWFHRFFNKLRGIKSQDVYPTYYRFNSIGKIKKLASAAGLYVHRLQVITGEPSYFDFSRVLKSLIGCYHFCLRRIKILNDLMGINLFVVLKK